MNITSYCKTNQRTTNRANEKQTRETNQTRGGANRSQDTDAVNANNYTVHNTHSHAQHDAEPSVNTPT